SSADLGSSCGLPGVPGMPVRPLVPCRTTRSVILGFPPLIAIPVSTTVAWSVIHGGPALSAFVIFHSSECCVLVKVPGGSGSVAVERSSANAVAGMTSMQTNAKFECLDSVNRKSMCSSVMTLTLENLCSGRLMPQASSGCGRVRRHSSFSVVPAGERVEEGRYGIRTSQSIQGLTSKFGQERHEIGGQVGPGAAPLILMLDRL